MGVTTVDKLRMGVTTTGEPSSGVSSVCVIVGGAEVLVGGAEVLVGGAEVLVGGAEVLVGGAEVLVGGAGTSVGGAGARVGGTSGTAGSLGAVGSTSVGGTAGNIVATRPDWVGDGSTVGTTSVGVTSVKGTLAVGVFRPELANPWVTANSKARVTVTSRPPMISSGSGLAALVALPMSGRGGTWGRGPLLMGGRWGSVCARGPGTGSGAANGSLWVGCAALLGAGQLG